MPMTEWEDVVGHACCQCGGPATHIYGDIYWCCDCHAGKDCGLISRKDAQAEHDRILAERAARCRHERLNEEGWCRACGADCRGIG